MLPQGRVLEAFSSLSSPFLCAMKTDETPVWSFFLPLLLQLVICHQQLLLMPCVNILSHLLL